MPSAATMVIGVNDREPDERPCRASATELNAISCPARRLGGAYIMCAEPHLFHRPGKVSLKSGGDIHLSRRDGSRRQAGVPQRRSGVALRSRPPEQLGCL